MGVDSVAYEAGQANMDELPAHEVTVSPFSIAQTEVTQELWYAVMGNNPSSFIGDWQRPVENVSWDDCQEFIARLNELTGMNFRLPTEAEWEYAARGGNKGHGTLYAGSDNIDEVAWYYNNSYVVGTDSEDYGTHAVGTKHSNELGLYDMSGNVWEWCNDYYGAYSAEAQTNPTGPASGTERIARGGAFLNAAVWHSVWFRNHASAGLVAEGLGFRLAL
jgi:formylglycine-generating enzyme required for sulfatase activity